MKILPLIGALLLSGSPVFADGESDQSVFKKYCMGFEDMEEDTRIQKGKFCDCMADLIYIERTEENLVDVAEACKKKYPPLN